MKLVTTICDLVIKAGRGFARIVGWLLAPILGKLSWNAPPWAEWSGAKFSSASRAAVAKPLWALVLLVALIAVGGGGMWSYQWWQARPKPLEVALTVQNPARTPIENQDEGDRGPRPLIVSFAQSVAPLSMAGKDVATGIQISPPLEGKWKWTSDKALEFAPKEDWPIGAEHEISFDQSLLASQIRLTSYAVKFQTPALLAKITRAEFYQDPTNPTLKKAVFDINFSHPVNSSELEKRITLQLAGQSDGTWGVGRETTKFTVSQDKLKLNAYVHSQNLGTPQEDSSIALRIEKGLVAARAGKPFDNALTKSVRVPGLASLSV